MLKPNLSKRNEILLNQMYGVPISIRVFTHMLGFQVDIKKLKQYAVQVSPSKLVDPKIAHCSKIALIRIGRL